MITPVERIVLKANDTLSTITLTNKGYTAIELNGIASGENSTQVGINGTGNMTWRLSDKVMLINGNETITANETITILAGYEKSALSGFTSGTAHGVMRQESDIITIDIDTTKYNIAAFEYYILGSKYIQQTVTSTATFAPGESFKIIMVDKDGIYLYPANTFPTPDDLTNSLEVGAIVTTNGVDISNIRNSSFFINEIFRNLYVWSKFVKRTNYLTNAAKITQNAVPRKLDVQEGKTIDSNMHLDMVYTILQLSVKEVYHVAGVYQIQPSVESYSVNITQFDNGTNLQTTAPNKFITHTLLRGSQTGIFYMVFGLVEYGTADAAKLAPIGRGLFPEGSDVDPIAQIVIDNQLGIISSIIDVRNT